MRRSGWIVKGVVTSLLLGINSLLEAQIVLPVDSTNFVLKSEVTLDSVALPLHNVPEQLVQLADSLQNGWKKPTAKQTGSQSSPRWNTFSPDPATATWTALVFPGGGQIYNHKYWKLPIVYGGFLGCAYALTWNNQMYSDYSQAYLDIMDDDPNTSSFEDFLPPNYNVSANSDYLKKVFKNRKDRYRRYRDLSIFSFIGVYLISVIDAYVDAELSHFDISTDLSLEIKPNIIQNTNCPLNPRNESYGLQCSFNF